jgi:hypothetical protein
MDERELIIALADALEGVMSSDTDMPTHENTMREAEEALERAREWLKDNPR